MNAPAPSPAAARAIPASIGSIVRAAAIVLVAGLLVVAAGPERAGAQDVARSENGWIGVGITSQAHDCPPGSGLGCGPAVVGSVILGGPADEAGIQPGDTLLAVGGDEIERGASDPAFRRIRRGEPLSILVARGGERMEIRVMPAPPPDSLAVVRVRPVERLPAPGAPPDAAAPGGYALALPEAARRPGVRAAPAVGAGPDSSQAISVLRVVPAGRAGNLSEEFVHARAEALREAMAEAREQMLDPPPRLGSEPVAAARARAREMELEAARMAAEQWRSWMDDSLRIHLDAIHDSVLSQARRQLRSLEQARAQQLREERSRRNFLLRSSGARDRIAGAELQGLSPELSEFFGGLEDGVLVLRVLGQTPAAELGLRPGDVIVEVGDRAVASVEDLRAALEAADAEPIRVKWIRKGSEMSGRLAR